MKEYIWKKSHHQYAYIAGDVCVIADEAKIEGLVEGGYIEEFERPKPQKKEKAVK